MSSQFSRWVNLVMQIISGFPTLFSKPEEVWKQNPGDVTPASVTLHSTFLYFYFLHKFHYKLSYTAFHACLLFWCHFNLVKYDLPPQCYPLHFLKSIFANVCFFSERKHLQHLIHAYWTALLTDHALLYLLISGSTLCCAEENFVLAKILALWHWNFPPGCEQ